MSEPFRDRTEGAIARRQDLLRKRRDEFVMMPHAIRRVVVARAARKAASVAILVSGAAMLVVAMSPSLTSYIARGLPGINPAVISTFLGATWILGLVAFATSRGRSEHRFAVAMSSTVLPGQDLDQDIERLSHEHPDEVARRMAHRLEVSSAALPVAAAAFIMPATLVYFAHAMYAKGWPSTAAYEANLALVASTLVIGAACGATAAIAMTRSGSRSPRVTAPALLTALATGGIAAFALFSRDLQVTWLCTVISVVSGSIGFINWRLAKERIALELEDPAAGSDLFTLRDLVDACKQAVITAKARISPSMVVGACAFGLLAIFAGSPVTAGTGGTTATTSMRGVRLSTAEPMKVFPGSSSYTVMPTGDGRLRITATFVNGKPIDLAGGLSGLDLLPPNWKASVTVRLETNDLPGPIAVTPFPGDHNVALLHLDADSTDQRFSTEVCDSRTQPLGLSMVPDLTWPDGEFSATFLVEPKLELSPCNQ
jgi:hypothetical protein